MNHSRIKHTAIAIVACATVAAVAGIATGAAAPSSNDNSASNGSNVPPPPFAAPIGPPLGAIGAASAANGKAGAGVRGPRVFEGPPVHSEIVVPNKSGDNFVTITQDSGTVKSVSGSQLTITEGTEKATYKTVTLDIPSDATVIRNGEKAELGDLQDGDQVHVSQSADDNFVFATDSQYQDKMMKQLREHLKNLPKPPPGFQGGPPPGLPPVPMARRGN